MTISEIDDSYKIIHNFYIENQSQYIYSFKNIGWLATRLTRIFDCNFKNNEYILQRFISGTFDMYKMRCYRRK